MRDFIDDHPYFLIYFIFTLILAIVVVSIVLYRPNYQILDTNWRFTWAIIQLGNGELIEGHVTSWRDFDQSDMIQVTIDDKLTILTHSSNVLLCNEQP